MYKFVSFKLQTFLKKKTSWKIKPLSFYEYLKCRLK